MHGFGAWQVQVSKNLVLQTDRRDLPLIVRRLAASLTVHSLPCQCLQRRQLV